MYLRFRRGICGFTASWCGGGHIPGLEGEYASTAGDSGSYSSSADSEGKGRSSWSRRSMTCLKGDTRVASAGVATVGVELAGVTAAEMVSDGGDGNA